MAVEQLTKRELSVYLDLNSDNKDLIEPLKQGSTDNNLTVSVMRNGTRFQVPSSAKITTTVLYNVNTQGFSEMGHVINPDDSGYDITIDAGDIKIPLGETYTTASGSCNLIIKIDDTTTGISYSYNMIYSVDETPGYKSISTADNLPTYNKVSKEIEDVKAEQTDQNNKISKNIGDISANTQSIATNTQGLTTKANHDLSNVKVITDAEDGTIFYVKDGKFFKSPLKVNDATSKIESIYSLEVPPNTLYIGDIVSLKEEGGFPSNFTQTLLKSYIFVDYENDPITGSLKPVYYKRGAKETAVVVNTSNTEEIICDKPIHFGFSSYNRQVQRLGLDFKNAVTNLKLKINVNSRDCAYYPSKNAWNDDTVNGYNLSSGVQYISLVPFFATLTSYDITITFKADSTPILKGLSGKPYLVEDLNTITALNIALEDDIPSTSEIAQALNSARLLDYNSLINTPANSDTEKVEFSKIFAIRANNKTGNVINAGSFVYLEAENDGTFNVVNITKAMGYKGELIGHTSDEVKDNEEGVFNLIASIKTNTKTLTEGESAYIGFTTGDLIDNTIAIGRRSDIAQPFGRCGVFGKSDTNGNTYAIYNTFSVMADYFGKQGDGSAITNTQVRDLLQSLTGDDRLGIEDLKDVEDTISGDYIATKLNDFGINITKVGDGSKFLSDNGSYKKIASGSDPSLSVKVDANTKEIERMKQDISDGSMPIYAWRDRGVPTVPNDKPYKAYFIHSIVLRDNTSILNIPSNAPDGAIFSVENNSRINYLTIKPPLGQTINSTNSYQAGHDTLSFFVRQGNDWLLAYGGVFPNNYSALKSTIQTLFPNSLHTEDEVKALILSQSTIKYVQEGLDPLLHTEDDIKEIVGLEFGYGTLDTSTPSQDLNWVIANINPNAEVLIPASNQGDKYLAIYMPVYLGALVSEVMFNQAVAETTSHKVVHNELDFTVLVLNDQIDTTKTNRLSLSFHNKGAIPTGIEFDDGSVDSASVNKVNLKNGLKIIKSDVTGEIDLSGGMTFLDGNTGSDFISSKIQSLDKSIRIANLNGIADLSKGKTDHNSGIHVCLGNDELINSKFGKSKLYFADYRVRGDSFVYADMDTKSFVIQDIDPQDDPNVSGGTTFIIALYFEPNLLLENTVTQDGYIDLELVDNNDDAIIGTDDKPMGVRLDYKSGDIVKPELYIGECQAKAYTEVHMKINLGFTNEEIISVGANTQLCIQAINKNESSGLALLSFMAYTGFRLGFDNRYYGYNSLNLARALVFDEPETEINNDTWVFGENLFLNSVSKLKLSISNYHLILKDNGTDIPIWTLAKIYNELDTSFIKGKTYKVKATLVDKDDAFNVCLMKYTGTTHPIPKPFVKSYNNTIPVFETGWSIVGTLFISEDAISSDHVATKTFTLPTDANIKSFAIIMFAVSSQIPMNLKLKDLEGDIEPWFNRTIITNNSHISEEHLIARKEIYKFVVGNQGFASYRFTANNTDTKVPIGIVKGRDSKITNNNAWADAGAVDPNNVQGDFEFSADGKVEMSYSVRCFNEQGTLNEIHFWLAKVNGDGTFSEVPNSRIGSTIEANRTKPKMINSPKFTFDVTNGESYRMFMKSDLSDGFYIQANTDGIPMYEAIINFDELTAGEQDLIDKLNLVDAEIVFSQSAIDNGVYLYADYDVDSGRPSITAKIK